MKKLAPVLALLLIALGIGAYFLFVRESTQDEASLGDAPLIDGNASGASGTVPDTPAGTWKLTQNAKVFAGYRIQKTLATHEDTITGRTGDVSGSLTIEADTLTQAQFSVNTTTITSGQPLRDKNMKTDGLETTKFPTAELQLAEPLELGQVSLNTPLKATAKANLTLHGVTKLTEVSIEARWNGTSVDITANAPIALTDFGITPPSVPGATVASNGILEAQLAFVK